ncbi:MAG: acyl carrier protein [Candidatus Rokubacteria bacterium]|nr:acyl carrier protein [Candidatus Rokubacteria bacterium]
MIVEEQVKEILLRILDIKEQDIVPTATFIDDLGASSIDLVEIFTAFENTFDVEIREGAVSKSKTVQDAIDVLKVALDQKGAST